VGAAALSEGRGVFRGWQVVAAAFSVLFFAYGLQFSYGVFASGMAAELGWSRAATALPYSLYVFLYSALERRHRARHRPHRAAAGDHGRRHPARPRLGSQRTGA
jgi:hypothetical protein